MNAEEILKACEKDGLSLSEYAVKNESESTGLDPDTIRARFERMLEVMEKSALTARQEPVRSVSGLTGGDAYQY